VKCISSLTRIGLFSVGRAGENGGTSRTAGRQSEGILFIAKVCLTCGMNVVFDFNSGWYVLLLGFLLSWAALAVVRRKRYSRKELAEQVFLALCGMFALALMEFFAVSTNLWSYTPENWPVILWPTYFAAILFGYQLLRSIEGLLRRPVFASKV
jgi:hypothetical protein